MTEGYQWVVISTNMNGDNMVIPRRDPPKLGMQLVMLPNVWELWDVKFFGTQGHACRLCFFLNGMMADNTKKRSPS